MKPRRRVLFVVCAILAVGGTAFSALRYRSLQREKWNSRGLIILPRAENIQHSLRSDGGAGEYELIDYEIETDLSNCEVMEQIRCKLKQCGCTAVGPPCFEDGADPDEFSFWHNAKWDGIRVQIQSDTARKRKTGILHVSILRTRHRETPKTTIADPLVS